MSTERAIENKVIRNRADLGFPDSLYIRRCRIGPGFGVVDLVLLPVSGPYRLVLVEAKLSSSVNAQANVVGQLLMYYVGVAHLGMRGLRYLREFAATQPKRARSVRPKLLQSLTGGITPPADAWAAMQRGRKLSPAQVALFIAIDGEPAATLKATVSTLSRRHDLHIGLISVTGRDDVRVL